jgi:hypothetical protein
MNPDSPGIQLDPTPRAGVETVVTVLDGVGRPSPGVTVQAIHRPGLSSASETALGITDSLGRVRWTPEMGGVVELRAGTSELRTSVAWEHPPEASVTLLALLLAGGVAAVAYGFSGRRLAKTSKAP